MPHISPRDRNRKHAGHTDKLHRGQKIFVPEHYPKDASGKLEYDKNLIKELETKTTGVLRNMCKHNPPSAQRTYKDKKADLIYKRVFCDFI